MEGIQGGDTAWVLVSTALVMLMTPGLAFFYGGMVQGRNVLSTFMHSLMSLALVSLQWVLIGYSLAFGESLGGVVGGLTHVGFAGVGMEAKGTIPHLLFAAYQCMFAAITPALISGAFAERMKFSAFVVFTLAWTTLVYDPIAHWVWAPEGWLLRMGALDFAGGTVVHVSAGVSALVAAGMIGKRVGYPQQRRPPHNLTLTVLGGGLLWFGWFGFNAGSALGANGAAALAFTNTHLAAAAGTVSWIVAERWRVKKATMLGAVSGAVSGLVAITPAAGFVGPMASVVIGLVAGVACYGGVLMKGRFGYDDSLDAFGVHGVGGALGAVLTGVFASAAWNPAAPDGLMAGNWGLVGLQLLGVVAAGAYAAAVTYTLLAVLTRTTGLRVDNDEEREGLDTTLHGESAYDLS